MRRKIEGTVAILACLWLVSVQSASAQRQRQYEHQTANRAAEMAGDSLASYNSFEPGGCESCALGECCGDCAEGSCDLGCCDTGCCDDCCDSYDGKGSSMMSRPGQLFFIGEYIYARPSFSEALAYIVSDANDPIGGQEIVEFDFGYKSSYRFSGGYRFCDCGGAIVFNYARYRGESAFQVQDTSIAVGRTSFSPYEVNAPTDNGILIGDADVDLDSYDLGLSKTIPLGGPLGCSSGDCCDNCCADPCGCGDCCCWCPAWDITWSAAVRFADLGWARGTTSFESDGIDQVATARTLLDFEGMGARVGLLGRRYFGKRGFASIYAKGDISLLVGDVDIYTDTINDPDGTAPFAARSHENHGRRMIPVTEIEAGLSAHIGCHVTLSAGYFLSAWHDLGFRDEYNWVGPDGGGGGGFQLSHYDDANILGFDGLFARAEVAF